MVPSRSDAFATKLTVAGAVNVCPDVGAVSEMVGDKFHVVGIHVPTTLLTLPVSGFGHCVVIVQVCHVLVALIPAQFVPLAIIDLEKTPLPFAVTDEPHTLTEALAHVIHNVHVSVYVVVHDAKTVTDTAFDVAVAPILSVAIAVIVYVHAQTPVRLYVYGEVVSVDNRVDQLINCTCVIVPSGSDAIASISIVAGATNGAILSGIISDTVGY